VLVASLSTNLGLLAFFKYYNFFVESLTGLLATAGLDATGWRLDLVLPVGISFYTFQTLSYTLDVYRGRLEPTRDPLDFALFVAFFPQLVAGPIERAKRLLPQIQRPRRIGAAAVDSALFLIAWGLWKKVVVADNLAAIVDPVFAGSADVSAAMAYLAVVAFAFQIYCDFSGYTDIARGLARLLGFELMLNFNLPYFARNPSDFWRRWHISLSTWLRDYLYISLGGNRGPSWFVYRNLMLTMVLGGLWHGASWNFVWWGVYHGAILGLHRFLTRGRVVAESYWRSARDMFLMWHLTLFGWLLFRATRRVDGRDESFAQIIEMLCAPANGWTSPGAGSTLVTLACFAGPLVAMQIAQQRRGDPLFVLQLARPWRAAFYAALALSMMFWGVQAGSTFIYFQF